MADTNDLLTQILDQLQKLNTTAGILNEGNKMLIKRLDDIGECVGGINAKLPSLKSSEECLSGMQRSLDDLPLELASAMRGQGQSSRR